ncbi:hypothetical protein ACET3Z_012753 [Daucus carota]
MKRETLLIHKNRMLIQILVSHPFKSQHLEPIANKAGSEEKKLLHATAPMHRGLHQLNVRRSSRTSRMLLVMHVRSQTRVEVPEYIPTLCYKDHKGF